jgi:peptidoglycan/LPS O-acetylase OafA/YrhL
VSTLDYRGEPPASSSSPFKSRDPNLDFLRASAIAAVMLFHVAQFWSVRNTTINKLTQLGQFGVELFFVLSGWLIGGLYWRERQDFGHVDVRRFWYRRWLRTLPPYYSGFALAYLAVRIGRGQPFDFGYLVFVQNCYPKIPFFVVSWSLCVEEQFYLLLPLLLLLFIRLRALPVLLLLTVAAPIVLRFIEAAKVAGWPGGSSRTHLRCDALALGVFCSYLRAYRPVAWARCQSIARVLFVPAFVGFISIAFWPREKWFGPGLTLVTITMTLALASVAHRRPLPGARSRAVYCLAIWSYSIYLTHNLVLLTGSRLSARFPTVPHAAHLLAWAVGMVAAGWVFFRLVELPAIRIRDRWVPRGVARPDAENFAELQVAR